MHNGNGVETICDAAIRLFINSVTKQLVTESIVDVQLIDFLNSSMVLDELVINTDNNMLGMEVTERAKLIMRYFNFSVICTNMFSSYRRF